MSSRRCTSAMGDVASTIRQLVASPTNGGRDQTQAHLRITLMEQRNKQQNNGGGTIEHHKGTRSDRFGADA